MGTVSCSWATHARPEPNTIINTRRATARAQQSGLIPQTLLASKFLASIAAKNWSGWSRNSRHLAGYDPAVRASEVRATKGPRHETGRPCWGKTSHAHSVPENISPDFA